MVGNTFPVSDYYRPHILDGETVARGGGWWTAVLLIADPVSGRPFIALYQWESSESGWKARKRFSFKGLSQATNAIEIVQRFSSELVE
jgi:hypothetical protein